MQKKSAESYPALVLWRLVSRKQCQKLQCQKKIVFLQIKTITEMDATTIRTSNSIKPIMHYWGMVKDMDDKQKLELISMLISSMRLHPSINEDEKEKGFRSLAGCWVNDNGDDDIEAIISKGREGRRGSRIIPSFDE